MKGNRGFIGILILLIISLALLKYFFDWSIFDALSSERGKATVEYIRNVLDIVWSYIRTPLLWIWDRVVELLPTRS